MAMSEKREFSMPVKVKFSGYDTRRYAVVKADSSMSMQVESTGFNAFILGLKKEPVTFVVDIKNEAMHRYTHHRDETVDIYRSVSVADLASQCADHMTSIGVRYISCARDSLWLVLNERSSKTVYPDLDNLKINFSDGYGLYGEPIVSPAEITLYGSPEALDAIGNIGVEAITLDNVNETGTYHVPIDKKWKSLGDVYASSDMLTINIPVKRYVEQRYIVPVTVAGIDSIEGLRLYPDRAKLHVWVAQDDLAAISAERFNVSVNYSDILAGAQRLPLNVNRFPREVRIRKIEPEEIEYIIIK